MTKHKMRFGIVGPGSVAHLHCAAIVRAENAELAAVLGRNEDKTHEFAEKYGMQAYTASDAFFTSTDFEAVTIATPSGSHLQMALQAAASGKHILCEKPLEVTSDKAEKILQICEEKKVNLGVFFQARFDRCSRLAKEAIDTGRLGKILLASCQMRWYRTQEYYDSAAWRGTLALDGGGSLMNQGIHTIDLLVYLIGEVTEVSAFKGPVTHERIEVEDNLCAVIRFQNGAIGTVEASTSCAPGFPRRVEISGDKGSIGIEDNRIVRWDFTEELPGDKEILQQFNNDKSGAGGAADPMAIDSEGHYRVVEDFVLSLQNKSKPFVDGGQGKKAGDIVCAVYESIKTGKTVRLDRKEKI